MAKTTTAESLKAAYATWTKGGTTVRQISKATNLRRRCLFGAFLVLGSEDEAKALLKAAGSHGSKVQSTNTVAEVKTKKPKKAAKPATKAKATKKVKTAPTPEPTPEPVTVPVTTTDGDLPF